MEKEFQEFQQRHAAKVLQKQWRTYQGNKTQTQLKKQAEAEAAKTLQREWRKHVRTRWNSDILFIYNKDNNKLFDDNKIY